MGRFPSPEYKKVILIGGDRREVEEFSLVDERWDVYCYYNPDINFLDLIECQEPAIEK